MYSVNPLSVFLLFLLLAHGKFICAILLGAAVYYFDEMHQTHNRNKHTEVYVLYALAILYNISCYACFLLCFMIGSSLLLLEFAPASVQEHIDIIFKKLCKWYNIGKACIKHVPSMLGYRPTKHVKFDLHQEIDLVDSILEN